MKHLIFTLAMMICLLSCEQDAFESSSMQFTSIGQSEISASVGYMYWSDTTCEPGSHIHPGQMVSGIPNARVELFFVDSFGNDQPAQPIANEITDPFGHVVFRNITPGLYRLSVNTSFGGISTTVFTEMNKRASVDLRY